MPGFAHCRNDAEVCNSVQPAVCMLAEVYSMHPIPCMPAVPGMVGKSAGHTCSFSQMPVDVGEVCNLFSLRISRFSEIISNNFFGNICQQNKCLYLK